MSGDSESTVPKAVVNFPKRNRELITFCRAMLSVLVNNASFPSPNPPLSVFKADIDAFDEAETKVATRVKGAAKQRDVHKTKVKEDVFHIRDYVQSVVEAARPATASALIQSAFMSVRKVPARSFPELSAKNTDVSGKVTLTTKAVRSATYVWEYSLDQSTWTSVPETMRARTQVSGLTSAHVYYFRFRAFTREGWREPSQVVSLLVH